MGLSPRIAIVRHAETRWSLTGQHTSTTDLPLTRDGRAKAAAIRGVLDPNRFACVFTSPLQRARQTSELAGFGGRAEVRVELSEWDYGDYEGLTSAEIRRRAAAWSLWTDGAPGGEVPEQVSDRVDRLIADVRAIEGDVALFSHGHLSRCLAARWIDLPVAAGQSFLLATAAISVLGWDRGTPVIERWNDDNHVRRT